MSELFNQAKSVIIEIIEKGKVKKGGVVVVGCSTSEILGKKIGTNSAPEVAKEVFNGLFEGAKEKGVYLAIQCCEHLNRAIVTEREIARLYEEVNVIPQPKAGGSLATVAYSTFTNPIVIEEIKADAGIDIGLTLIGMHLKKVAVPVRLENNKIGEAIVVGARVRPKFVGGSRAIYNEELL